MTKNALCLRNSSKFEYLNSFKKDHKKALELLEHYHVKYQLGKAHNSFFHLEKGKALFGLNNFELAIVELKKMKIAEYFTSPVRFSNPL